MITPTDINGAQTAGYDPPYALHTEPWMEQGLCVGRDPELWFPDQGDWVQAAIAKGICAECPVRKECLDYIMRTEHAGDVHRYGIWAGTTPRDRARIKAGQGIEVEPEPESAPGAIPGAGKRTGQRRDAARCGTTAGEASHRYYGEKPCAACLAAKRKYDREYRWRRQGRSA